MRSRRQADILQYEINSNRGLPIIGKGDAVGYPDIWWNPGKWAVMAHFPVGDDGVAGVD